MRTRHRRRATPLVVLVAVLAVLGVACSVPPARFGDLRTSPDEDSLPIGYVPPPPARVLTGVPYGLNDREVADVYLPESPAPGAPVLIYLHGGGWTGGTRAGVPAFLLRQGSRMGAAVVSAEYAIATAGAPETAFPAASRDVDHVIRWAKSQAPSWGNAPHAIVLGTSAGGNLALIAALAPGRFIDPGLPPDLLGVSPAVMGVVSLAGPVDTAAMYAIQGWRPTVLEPYLDCSPCSATQVNAANPLTYLGGSVPPAYLAYGVDDWLIPADVHGLPTAVALMRARGDDRLEPGGRAIWYELAEDDHDIDQAHINVRYFEIWLDQVASNHWPVAGA